MFNKHVYPVYPSKLHVKVSYASWWLRLQSQGLARDMFVLVRVRWCYKRSWNSRKSLERSLTLKMRSTNTCPWCSKWGGHTKGEQKSAKSFWIFGFVLTQDYKVTITQYNSFLWRISRFRKIWTWTFGYCLER